MLSYFDSRDIQYRFPTGAVPVGNSVHFRICLPRRLQCSGAKLCIGYDNAEILSYEMFWCGMLGEENEWWECDFSPEQDGIYWYSFELCGEKLNKKYLGKAEHSKAKLSEHSHIEQWQLTVYQSGFVTPEWLKGGLIYQIFPDRFNRSAKVHEGIPAERQLHSQWQDEPDWQPDSNGKITNSDYFGGDLAGIIEKLEYLKKLGVSCIYLNPIFEAHENHRYNTANYEKIDPMLGTEEDFRKLCCQAKKLDMRVILDGVFSHTGSDSIYFNKNGRYAGLGAFQAQSSLYYPWYKFRAWPEAYDAWWGIPTLPELNEEAPEYLEYITGKNGILRKWMRAGASGWRLDVADELPDIFLDKLRESIKEENPQALIIGEVWEDATNKEAYGQRRRYLQGQQLDSVMNYPFKDAVLGFITGYKAEDMLEIILNVLENYPPQVVNILMNHIGTHDTQRAITVLAGRCAEGRNRAWQSVERLNTEQREYGFKLLQLASLLQYTLPGVPSLYYGDEAGVEGYCDPFNRRTYPWGSEEKDLIEWYCKLGSLRRELSVLKDGEFTPHICADRLFSFTREKGENGLFVAINSGWSVAELNVPDELYAENSTLLGIEPNDGSLVLPPLSFSIISKLENFCV
ncbi:MAG: glycoside hydrolase family 13 protein [Oscillospiraceae bacterium]|jgi:glycosidase|nr:glycoside hydrolase family 13 protein [Oscillospiraceae bacterium]